MIAGNIAAYNELDYAGDPETAAFQQGQILQNVALGMGLLGQVREFSEGGRFTMGDGTVITTEMLSDPDPIVASQALFQWTQAIGGTVDDFNRYAEGMGLGEFKVSTDGRASAAAAEANAQAQQTFTNRLAQLGAQLDVEDVSSRRIGQQTDRALRGLAESRSRADTAIQRVLEALPLSSPEGKTSFTANELGAGVGTLARRARIDPTAPLLNYTGQVNINPEEQFARFDQQLGVAGGLPEIPDISVGPGDVPALPGFQSTAVVPEGAPPILRFIQDIGSRRSLRTLGADLGATAEE
jgi:hypothetical protein